MSRKKHLKFCPELTQLSGWLILAKPSGPTSRDLLNLLQKQFHGLKIGHAGTLDPLASGLLLVAIGHATRLVEFTHRFDKSYEATIRLGATSPTDDADGPWSERPDAKVCSLPEIREGLSQLTGPQVLQIPPRFSAIQKGGQRSYDLARKGEEFELEPRPVRIDKIEIMSYEWPLLQVFVHCGAGTYIRSIARDLGEICGVGGMIEKLHRTRIGPFEMANAIATESLCSIEDLKSHLIPPDTALSDWPEQILDDQQLPDILHGKKVSLCIQNCEIWEGREICCKDQQGNLIALGRIESSQSQWLIQPFRVFHQEN